MTNKTIKLPKPNQAEKWLTPDIFIFQGHQYEVTIYGKVMPVGGIKKYEP